MESYGTVGLKPYQIGEILAALMEMRRLARKHGDRFVVEICDDFIDEFHEEKIEVGSYPECLRRLLLEKMISYKENTSKEGRSMFRAYQKMVKQYQVIAYYLMRFIKAA